MKPFNSIDEPLKSSSVNEVTHNINPNYVDTQWMQPNSSPSNQCEIHSNSCPVPKTSILMPGNVQIHIQVLLNDAEISKETRIALYKLLQIYDTIISKSDNDIGQTDLMKMHIATRPDAALIAA